MGAEIYGHDVLARFTAEQSDDEVKRDLELTCEACGAVVCDIEAGDSLSSLAGCANDHECDDDE
jgi:hypothetical protein